MTVSKAKKPKKTTTKKTPAKPKSPTVAIIEHDDYDNFLLPTNPLLQSPVITVNDENEQKIEIINEIESLATINKQQLAVRRDRVAIEVDNKKLDAAKKAASSIEKIIDSIASEEVLDRVKANIKTPMDMKFMADAADKLSSTLKNLMNPNVADELGNKKKQKINFMFKSSGTVQGAIQIDNSDD